jgi:hypothetical protein
VWYAAAAVLGALAVPALAGMAALSPWLAALLGVGFFAVFPKVAPRLVATFLLGAALVVVVLSVVWVRGWGSCASEVDGVVVEHDCGRAPPSNPR